MSVLVTGAAGFIGCWLTRALAADGMEVIAQMRREPSSLFRELSLDRHPRIEIVGDADIAAVVRDRRPAAIYHLAGMSQIGEALRKPHLAFEANARATWLLLEALRDLAPPAPTILASTDSIYGETGGRAASEEHPTQALGPYEASKLMADIAARSYAAQFGLPIVVARLGNVYGPGDENAARLVPSLLRAVRSGRAPQLRGGGRAVRSLLHVVDCVAALRLLAANADRQGVRGEAFNVSGEPAMAISGIARLVLDAAGLENVQPDISDDAPGETSVKVSSSEKLVRRLGWRPTIPLLEGVEAIVAKIRPEPT
ncbi:MAG: NAD(P)-dependent oxidoreductase [Rhizobiaceae bacterium]|nr:NAD(P)-dependent oxidoreductase [Rhizobiaceae bacterium]